VGADVRRPGFEALAATLEALLDRHAQDGPEVRRAYRRAMDLELGFFDGAMLVHERTGRHPCDPGGAGPEPALAEVVDARVADVGGVQVRRSLPRPAAGRSARGASSTTSGRSPSTPTAGSTSGRTRTPGCRR
jgi:hypothetical protein